MDKIKGFFSKINVKLNKFDDFLFPLLRKYMWIIVIVLALTFSTIGKFFAFSFLSSDYNNFLKHWMIQYQEMGFIKGIGTTIGDYTPFYNYFLCLFAQFTPEVGFVYAIKWFNLVFEIGTATAFFLITYHYFKNLNYSSLAFAITLIIPSVIINGAVWGQCDIVFTMFIVWSFYFIITKRYNLAMIFFSISFAIKLQAVFFAPFIFFLILKREIKLWQIFYIPVIYILLALPALLAGRPFIDIISVYATQASEYSSRINLSAPSVFAFVSNNEYASTFSTLGLMLCLTVTLCYIFYLYHKDIELNKDNLITVALISILFTAFFLPHMHERYFFMADIFAVIYLFIRKRGFIICLLINMASLTCCIRFLIGVNIFTPLDPIMIGALMNLGAVTLLTREMLKLKKADNNQVSTCN